jgi:putative heme-binding domain-containing protein
MTCTQCHAVGDGPSPLGPDLTKLDPTPSDEELVEAILDPSRSIHKGYETVIVATNDGRTLSGLVAEETADKLVLNDPAHPAALTTLRKADIAERRTSDTSVMPAGLVEMLGSRQDFLDLTRYVYEVIHGGVDRARLYQPKASQLAAPEPPSYERQLDHAGMIAGLGPENYRRGEKVYSLVCVNCHGTRERAGSMPTSLRFSSGAFKNGADPYSLYRTLTFGYSQMTPQSWMVPRQKYDVIHYIREKFLRPHNPSQYTRVDANYLAGLPKGTTQGPEPRTVEPWSDMDYGRALSATYEIGDGGRNFAYKGVAVRLDPGPGGVAKGHDWAVYDHDTMTLSAFWTGTGFIDWGGINFTGVHEAHPKVVGRTWAVNPVGPGWADPETGSFDDPRSKGRDGRPYGPLPRSWARYKGQYRHGDHVVLAYTVGSTEVLESPGLERIPARADVGEVYTRTFDVEPHACELLVRIAPTGTPVATVEESDDCQLVSRGGFTLLHLPASPARHSVKVLIGPETLVQTGDPEAFKRSAAHAAPPLDLRGLARGGPRQWPEVMKTKILRGGDDGPFATDVLTHPASNPWNSRVRLSGLDFFPGGTRAAVCDWDGDVWLVDGVNAPDGELSWRRIASGLFQPLGLKIVDGAIYVACRDQIAILRDLNGDGETDFYECFNSDHQVTEHFHEFAMDLQTDAQGNFYYTKGARHAKKAIVPQHGTLLKVSRDGSKTEILATGFRAPNGVLLNPDGTFFVTDQEGHWIPKNRINLVKPGGFYGNMWGYHDVTDPSDSAMERPVVWITNAFDRSPSELVRIDSPAWRPLEGGMLNLSYGYGKVFLVLTETVRGQMQGGMVALPIPQLPTGVMRGRFNPLDGQLYACGMFAWAGTQEQPGGFYRLRRTEAPARLPVALHAKRNGVELVFTDPLDPKTVSDLARYAVKTWGLKRTENYGSPHVDEAPSTVTAAKLSGDGRTLSLEIPGLKPTWCMEIAYDLKAPDGAPVRGTIHNTIHHLP